MIHPETEREDRELHSCTEEELTESYDELAAFEPLARLAGDDAPSAGEDAFEDIASAEGRDGPAAIAHDAGLVLEEDVTGPADAETYAVMPELELLASMLEAVRAEAPPVEASDEPVPDAEDVSA